MQRRGLTLTEAADYCGVTPATYRAWIREGRVPRPWPGTRRYDLEAIREALDEMRGKQTSQPETLSKFEAWKATKNAATA